MSQAVQMAGSRAGTGACDKGVVEGIDCCRLQSWCFEGTLRLTRAHLMSKRMDLSMAANAVAVAARPATPSMMTGLLMRADRP